MVCECCNVYLIYNIVDFCVALLKDIEDLNNKSIRSFWVNFVLNKSHTLILCILTDNPVLLLLTYC